MLEPPVLADNPPKRIRKKIAKPYNEYSIFYKGRKSVTKKGSNPPTVNAAPEANAA
jgi:hypothetical protein